MGLDMYLEGEKFVYENPQIEDGFEVTKRTLQLGYWHKHPDLHGFIINEFADGKDNCQKIELGEEKLKKIIEAVQNDNLPYTTGCFFGESTSDDKAPSLDILTNSLEWLKKEEPGIRKTVVYQAYQASW